MHRSSSSEDKFFSGLSSVLMRGAQSIMQGEVRACKILKYTIQERIILVSDTRCLQLSA